MGKHTKKMIMLDWDFLKEITKKLCEIGKSNRQIPPIYNVEPFKHFFYKNKELRYNELDEYDGKFTRRELLSRYLLVSVVLDQGPDMVGVRELLKEVTTNLYRKEIRIFHQPVEFFKELGISIDEIINRHESIKRIRAEDWAWENKSVSSKYNLFFAQSMRGIISTKQVLDYTIHRWGVPLCLPMLLEKDLQKEGKDSPQPLVDFLESFPSAEHMAQNLKDHERYGLGSAIGDKACHLFAKMYVSIFKLVKYRKSDDGWTGFSYEIPFDSNAGRVLFRLGVLFELASKKDYEKWNVIQKGRGKGGVNYIRVTNIRNKKISSASNIKLFQEYREVVTNYLKTEKKPKYIYLQRIPNLLVYQLSKEGYNYSIADFDDGLIHIGTTYCFNHDNPMCNACEIKTLCKGYNERVDWIRNFRT